MRIIAGKLGGRLFESPRTARTHPMSDRARGGLFATLGDITGLTVLDAFAGSGALSFEAISRGAQSAVAIDLDKNAYRTIVENIARLGLDEEVSATRRQAGSWATGHTDSFFDIVLCDPPYNDLRRDILQKLVYRTKPGGVFVLSWPGHEAMPEFKQASPIRQKSYGDLQLVYYRRDADF
ncbi:MAG TPA: 16S rRNA (guanine(966)-N(2))-methyltransferase RsmD [Candidatus Limnocylindrales bacterium]|nr:16S rRNA (guanine(966)-N(2))-methyltransferase RsmD [Candidatus Limnocylindrales bacterium]